MPPPFIPPANNNNGPPSFNENVSEEMKVDDEIIADINREYAGGNDVAVVSTGNILEDLDNLMRIYRNLSNNDKERELVFKEFWSKYDLIAAKQPHLLLQLPTRVRGFLGMSRIFCSLLTLHPNT